MQLTFIDDLRDQRSYTATHNHITYLVYQSAFGWHAVIDHGFEPDGLYENVGEVSYPNRHQAFYACNLHANGGL